MLISHVPQALPIHEFLLRDGPVIDVRSPGEFDHGHIPGAHNIPLFSNEERAIVGTLYKNKGRDKAVLEGLRIIGPRMAELVERSRAIAPDATVRVHCWRGGERSASVAWLLEKAGFNKGWTLQRGYKAFREEVLTSFTKARELHVLGGYTGTGKTQLLHLLKERGEQVIDLEGLARHKGSSYGGIGEGTQPTTEHFENLLWQELRRADPTRTVWVEDESMNIGRVKVPDAFFANLLSAPVHFVDMPVKLRVERLVEVYGSFPKQELADATMRIERRLGPQHAKDAIAALERGDLHTVAAIALSYYDKTYARGLSQRDPARTILLKADTKDLNEIAARLLHHEHARHD
jgi:tRNA 2-selenouridine synthase